MVGAGVFTIKALPIGIAYEPPQDPGRLNSNLYTARRDHRDDVVLVVADLDRHDRAQGVLA